MVVRPPSASLHLESNMRRYIPMFSSSSRAQTTSTSLSHLGLRRSHLKDVSIHVQQSSPNDAALGEPNWKFGAFGSSNNGTNSVRNRKSASSRSYSPIRSGHSPR